MNKRTICIPNLIILLILKVTLLNRPLPSYYTLIHLILMIQDKNINLVIHQDTNIMNNITHMHHVNIDSFITKTCLLKLPLKNYHHTLHYVHIILYHKANNTTS
jgi:hypothetical protein